MHKKLQILSVLLILILMLSGCFGTSNPAIGTSGTTAGGATVTRPNATKPNQPGDTQPEDTSMGRDETTYGDSLEDLGVWNGYAENIQNNVKITCLTGSANRYRIEGDVITFNPMAAESVYTIEGTWKGSIVINTGDDYKFTLEMHGLTLIADTTNAITVQSGDEVSITAKKGYNNYIYDMRPAIDETDETLHPGAIYASVDLEIAGKGILTVYSENNNGIQTKDDLQVKNLTMTVVCQDNALKGNDSVEIVSADLTLIARAGDGIKTTSSDVSSKGNQRGTVSITDSICTVYAARDGIDAAYDVAVSGTTTVLEIYTDKYSNYSEEITAVTEDIYYIRFPMSGYAFSVKYYNSEEDILWVNATYHSHVSGGFQEYYYYTVPKNTSYAQMQVFVYEEGSTQGQDTDYVAATDLLTPHTSYDTFAFSVRGSSLSAGWTNYTTQVGGFGGSGKPGGPGGFGGGMQEGNTDKSGYSSKGIKAANSITVNAGSVYIKSYDDAMHASNDGGTLENGNEPLGNLTVKGGEVNLYTNDDGLHADGALLIQGGVVTVLRSYEGVEGTTVTVKGGTLSVTAMDDGINATGASGTGVQISAGNVYVYAGGDGIDANSKTNYQGIVFAGGTVVIISTSNGNSAIDTEKGYTYTGGKVFAIMPRGAMTQEAIHGQNFDSVGKQVPLTVTEGATVRVTVGSAEQITFTMPCDLAGVAVYLGANNAEISAA